MADTWSLVSVKSFTYRDQPEEFSNRYHFNGAMPDTWLNWKIFMDFLNAEERKIYTNDVTIVRGYGYVNDDSPAVAVIDYTVPPATVVPGTLAHTDQPKAPGDIAATVRWETGQLNSRGRKIYLRKYYHGVVLDFADFDKLDGNQKAAINTLAGVLTNGTMPGGAVLAGPHGVTAGAHLVNQFVTTRTLKRRGKRPTP